MEPEMHIIHYHEAKDPKKNHSDKMATLVAVRHWQTFWLILYSRFSQRK